MSHTASKWASGSHVKLEKFSKRWPEVSAALDAVYKVRKKRLRSYPGMNTITFKDLNNKTPNEVIFTQSVINEPKGITVIFLKGVDERTRTNRRYTAILTPGAGTGKWEYAGGESGDLERVTQKKLGKEIIVEGIWPEGGERKAFELYFVES